VNLPRAVSLAFLAVLLCVHNAAGSAADSGTAARQSLSATMHTRHFIVHYDPGDPYLAKLMADSASEQLLRISPNLGARIDTSRPFTLLVYPTHIGFIRGGGLEGSKFTVGTAEGGSETISVDASGAFAPAEDVLAHEIAHAILFRVLGPHVRELPLWLNEGIAQRESEPMTLNQRELVSEAAADGTLIPLTSLSESFPRERIALAYAESSSAVGYLVRRHGRQSVRVLISELANTGSFDKAMLAATGKTGDRFASDWYAHTTKRFWVVKLSRAVMATVSTLMAVLVIAAFLVRRKQKIEAARRYEQEEFEEALRRQLGNSWWR
jgi:hypothetical protein